MFGSYQKWCSKVLSRSTVKLCVKRQKLAAREKENAIGTRRIVFFCFFFIPSPQVFLWPTQFFHIHIDRSIVMPFVLRKKVYICNEILCSQSLLCYV